MSKSLSGNLINEAGTSFSSQSLLIIKLSLPGIIAQMSSIAMQYIDAGMVGSLGAQATAAVGLVSSTTWLLMGLCLAFASGYSVQVSQFIGAGKLNEAQNVLRQALIVVMSLSLVIAIIGFALSPYIPVWLGGASEIRPDAQLYIRAYFMGLPFLQAMRLSTCMLQASGDMKTPGLLNSLVCVFDVIFNFLFIFPTRTPEIALLGKTFTLFIPGMGLGVFGAGLGTALAQVVIGLALLYRLCVKSPQLSLKQNGSWKLRRDTSRTALYLAIPMALDHIVLSMAYIASTAIVATLGTVSIAAHSLAITAESLCYMPAYGISLAAQTLVGQAIGAGRKDLAKRLGLLTVGLSMGLMCVTGALMWALCPFVLALLTPVASIRALAVRVLRLELISEPFYGASTVGQGVLRGGGDTLIPGIITLITMWGIRISLSVILVGRFGLMGVWGAMTIELISKGIIFLVRLRRGKWLVKADIIS